MRSLPATWQGNTNTYFSLDLLPKALYINAAYARHSYISATEEGRRGEQDKDHTTGKGKAWRGYPFTLGLLLAACWHGTDRQVNEREFILAAMVGNVERMKVGGMMLYLFYI